MPERWLSREQLETLTGWSKRTIEQKVEDKRLRWRHRQERSRNGRQIKEYDVLSLPSEFQIRHQSVKAAVPQSAAIEKRPAQVVLFNPKSASFELPRIPAGNEHRELIEKRDKPVRMYLEFARMESEIDRRAWCQSNGLLLGNADSVAAQIARKHGVGRSQLFRWVKAFKEEGAAGLLNKPRSDKGTSRWMTKDRRNEELAAAAVYVHLEENISKRMAWEIVTAESQRIGIEPPSYETIRVLLESIPAPIKTLALKGRRKYDEMFAPYIRRGYTDFEAGQILVSDHAIHDVLVQNDMFDARDRQHMRLRFTGLLDMRSRKFVGYAWSQEGSSRSIVTCLRQSILKNGAPQSLYVDNGRDYQKVGRGAGRTSAWDAEDLSPETRGVLARLGIDVQYCIKFHPQSKLIERANNTLHQRFDRRFVTYTGPTPEQRPDRCIAALERHQKLLAAGRPDESDLPLASEFIKAAVVWIEGEYHQKAKDVEGMEGLTPNEAFEKFRWSKQAAPPSPEDLAPLLTERTTRTVQECTITLDGRRYEPADEVGYQMMHYHTGKAVVVAFDPLDLNQVFALDQDGRIIAYLQPERLLRQSRDEETSAAIAASMAQRQRLHRETRGQIEALGRRVRSMGYVSQHEQMLQLGNLPIDIEGLVVHRPQKHAVVAAEAAADHQVLLPGEAAERLAARIRRRV